MIGKCVWIVVNQYIASLDSLYDYDEYNVHGIYSDIEKAREAVSWVKLNTKYTPYIIEEIIE